MLQRLPLDVPKVVQKYINWEIKKFVSLYFYHMHHTSSLRKIIASLRMPLANFIAWDNLNCDFIYYYERLDEQSKLFPLSLIKYFCEL